MTQWFPSGPVPGDVDPRYTTRGAVHVLAGEGVHRWVSSDVNTVKLTGDHTHGELSLVEVSVPPGGGPPPHAHPTSETFYLLSGQLHFVDGGETIVVNAGDVVHVPGDIRHGFKNRGVHPARLLAIFAPSGPESGFMAIGEDARPGEQPPLVPIDAALAMADVLTESGLVLLPELPEQ